MSPALSAGNAEALKHKPLNGSEFQGFFRLEPFPFSAARSSGYYGKAKAAPFMAQRHAGRRRELHGSSFAAAAD